MLRNLGVATVVVCALAATAAAAPCPTGGPDLILSGVTCQMSGVFTFGTISLTNGTVIQVGGNHDAYNTVWQADGDDAQEAVLGRGRVEVNGECDRRPPVEVRTGLRVGVPTDA